MPRFEVSAERVALLPLGLITALIAWFAWERGAYFGVTFLPGAIILLGLLVALLLVAPFPARLGGPARVALGALLGLAAWTLLSAFWSPAPDIAIEDAQRVLAYAVAFALGLWLCLLAGRRMLLGLAPIAAAGALVAVATLFALAFSGDFGELLETDATLRYPVGYRNAVAAYFLMAGLPMLVLAAAPRQLNWRLRGALVAGATLALELAVLSQSRTSLFALVAGFAVLVAVHPNRLRILGFSALAVLPALPALPWLLDVFQAAGGDTAASSDPLRSAAAAMALTTALAGALGALAARRDPLIALSPGAARATGRALAGGAALVATVGIVVALISSGGPGDLISSQADELTAGSPDLTAQGSRFGLDLRSERGDLWRVALDDLAARPLSGEGGGGWRFSYLLDRETVLQPEDPHSVVMLMGSELGLPGLLLFGTFIVAATVAALRTRRLGPSAAQLAAGALALGAYWLVHASAEWFWAYPAVTLPMAFALGAAAAPAMLDPAARQDPRRRRAIAAAAGVAALSLLPFFASERYTENALRDWRSDLSGAYADLDRAAAFNPVSDRPLASEAVIAEAAGEPQRALGALQRAQERQPEEWTLYLLEARVLADLDPAAARRALSRAYELNPRGEEIAELERSLPTP